MKVQKAKVTKFKYAGIEIEGLLCPNGEYRIALAQISRLLFGGQKLTTKQLESRLDIALSGVEKIPTELNSNKANTLTLDNFANLCVLAVAKDAKKYPLALSITQASVKQSITIAFEVAVGIERTNKQEALRFEDEVESKSKRLELTDIQKLYFEKTGVFPAYGKYTLLLYKAIGLEEKHEAYKKEYPTRSQRSTFTFRHHYITSEERQKITDAEINLKFMVDKLGMTLDEAITKL